jgi:hypothetical protein
MQRASLSGKRIAALKRNAPLEEDARRLREELEDAQWRRELMEKSREEKAQELAGKRAELAHLEDHIQRLESQAKELLTHAKKMRKNGGTR